MIDAILVLNAGSSSIKFAVYAAKDIASAQRLCHGSVSGIGESRAQLMIKGSEAAPQIQQQSGAQAVAAADHGEALQIILHWLEQETVDWRFIAAGHRVVHGGDVFFQPVRVDETVLAQLTALVPLAPLHQPFALHAMQTLLAQRPQLPQVACFDTAFHATLPWQEQYFALPRALYEQGVRRYGFHGLSYEYVVSVLPAQLGETANGKVVISHLGHGVSMCAINNLQSVATTMSFTPLDGLPMGTRSGSIDPAVVLYLQSRGMTQEAVSDLLHHQSGLLGLSGISGDMQALLASQKTAAAETVAYFCYRVSRELGSLAAALGGLDAVVFTGGIGEHAAVVREKICQAGNWLGIVVDDAANQVNATRISPDHSPVSVWVIPTDEEQAIARHTAKLLEIF